MSSIEVREARRVGSGESIEVARAGKGRSSERGSMRTLYRRGMSSRPLHVDRSDLLVVTAVACRSIRSSSPRRRCLPSSGADRSDLLALVVAACRVLVPIDQIF
ncbi:unnamed protein product [Linum trigynum]|uniref:Uncharacterized protein n=1 Tax=Linum trigynum TaxID=586398 RepID=A0AAV2G8N9_9ROSI